MDGVGSSRRKGAVQSVIRLSAAILLVCPPAFSLDPARAVTQYKETQFTSDDGLPQNSVHAIAQTNDGYLWLGTEEGLARFDGVQFTIISRKSTHGLASDYIQALTASRDGSLWIGTDSGLSHLIPSAAGARYAPGKQRLERYSVREGLPGDNVSALLEDHSGTLWVGTTQGLRRIRDGRIGAFASTTSLGQAPVHSIVEGSGGRIWVGTDFGLFYSNGGDFVQWTKRNGLPENAVLSLTSSPNGDLWVATRSHGVVQIHQGHILPLSTPVPWREIYAILADREGALWIAFDRHGLARLDHGKIELLGSRSGLPSDRCTHALFEDREGNLWAGLLDGGVVELHSDKFFVFGKPEGLSGNYVGNVLQARDGSMWIGSDSNGVNHLLSDGRIEVWDRRKGLPDQAVYSLAETRDGSLWIGYKEGSLARIFHNRIEVYHDPQAKAKSLNALFEDRDGTLWAGFFGAGIARFEQGHFHHLSLTGRVPQITQSSDGALWIAFDGDGIERILHGSITRYTEANGLPTNHVMSIYADSDNTIWVGTASGGLSRIRDGHIVTWGSDQGLPETTIGSIIEDNFRYLWCGGDSGIFRISKDELNRSTANLTRSIHATVYGISDGLRSRETLYGSMPATWKDQSGRLWFSTIMGAAVIDPAKLKSDSLTPQVWIENVRFNSREIALENGVSLGRGSGNLAVSFTAPSFRSPKQMQFRYRLEGFDRDWTLATNRRDAWYTNLPSGSYRFIVQAANSDGTWNLVGASWSFVLQPPLSRTPAAFFSYVVVAVLLIWAAISLRTRNLLHRQRELTHLVAERTRQLESEKRELINARQELQFRATHDALTGLWSRGPIMESLVHEFERAHRDNTVFTIALGDLDHFKQVNDSQGHLCGDAVLAEAARRLRSHLRSYDHLGRYGGEEFLIIMPGHDAVKDPDRVLGLVTAFSAQPFRFDGRLLRVTCSFGVVVSRPDLRPESIEQLLRRADEALYRAKNAGRDRAEFYRGSLAGQAGS